MVTSEQVRHFRAEGYCVLEGLISPSEAAGIVTVAESLAGALLSQRGSPSEPSSDGLQPSRFLRLVRSDRAAAGRVFDALVKIPLVQRVVYSERLQRIAEQLLDSDLVLSSPSQMNLRADHPEEPRFLYPWHTDYSYNCSSTRSLVFWIPLQPVDLVNGALHLLPRSHLAEPVIRCNEAAIARGMSSEYFEIENIGALLGSHQEIRCPLDLGQAVVFHARLIHRSGANRSDRTRFALQSRWFDALAPDAVARQFVGGMDEGVHPREYL